MAPIKRAGMMNSDRVRNPIVDNRWDDDGFWKFGYGNDPRRRRFIRRVEKRNLQRELDKTDDVL